MTLSLLFKTNIKIFKLAAMCVFISIAGLYLHSSAASMKIEDFSKLFGKTLVIGFYGQTSDDPDVQEARELIERNLIAGVVLFRYNIQSPEQVKKLITYLTSGHDVIVAVDQEGGKVSRIDEANGFTYTMPSAKSYSSAQEVYDSFAKMAVILKDVGINVNFAPVLDIDHNPPSPVIGKFERSFSPDINVVIEYGAAAIKALADNGISACGKHFPGHGSAQQDSHLDFTDVTQYWSIRELEPFEKLKSKLPYIMVAHTFNKNIDPEFPASMSKTTYQLLKDYQGKFITDDYFMKAVAEKYSEAEFAVRALSAGSSFVTLGQSPNSLKVLNKQKIPVKKFITDLHNRAYKLYKEGMLDHNTLKKRVE